MRGCCSGNIYTCYTKNFDWKLLMHFYSLLPLLQLKKKKEVVHRIWIGIARCHPLGVHRPVCSSQQTKKCKWNIGYYLAKKGVAGCAIQEHYCPNALSVRCISIVIRIKTFCPIILNFFNFAKKIACGFHGK